MKVLQFAPEMELGSPDTPAADLAYALREFDVVSTVAAPSRQLLTHFLGAKVKYVRFAVGHLFGLLGNSRHLQNIIRKCRPDVLHAYGYEAVAIATRARRFFLPSHRPLLVGTLSTYPKDVKVLNRSRLTECDALTFNHTELRVWLRSYQAQLVQSWIIPHGVNDELCHPRYKPDAGWVAQWKQIHPQLAKRFVICLPAPVAPEFCTQHITPILSMLRSQDIPAHALLVGSTDRCDPEFMRTLHQSLRAAGMDDFVTHLPTPENLRDVLCMSHAVLCLTQKPIIYHQAALHALALGRPTAGYGHGAILDYLEAMQPMGVLPVGNVDSAADILSQWYSAPPDPPDEIPYPYKLKDTAQKIYELYTNLKPRY